MSGDTDGADGLSPSNCTIVPVICSLNLMHKTSHLWHAFVGKCIEFRCLYSVSLKSLITAPCVPQLCRIPNVTFLRNTFRKLLEIEVDEFHYQRILTIFSSYGAIIMIGQNEDMIQLVCETQWLTNSKFHHHVSGDIQRSVD